MTYVIRNLFDANAFIAAVDRNGFVRTAKTLRGAAKLESREAANALRQSACSRDNWVVEER